MWKLRLYLSQMLLVRWLVVAVGLVLLVGLLESLSVTSEIANKGQGTTLDYMWLRSPVVFDHIFVFTLMVALVFTFVSLIRRDELVALQGFGLSLSTQFRLFAPTVLMIAGISAVFINFALPPAVRALNDWGVGRYKEGQISPEEPLWLNDEGLFVSITGREGKDRLTGVTFFQRDDRGRLLGTTWAKAVTFRGDHWELTGTEHLTVKGARGFQPIRTWHTAQHPATLDRLAAEPRNLSLADLARFAELRGSGARPTVAYKIWSLTRLGLPMTCLALLLTAIPIMQQLGRRATGVLPTVTALGLTFVFMIADGVTKTLGAAGAMPPVLAAWGASLALGGLGLCLALGKESLG